MTGSYCCRSLLYVISSIVSELIKLSIMSLVNSIANQIKIIATRAPVDVNSALVIGFRLIRGFPSWIIYAFNRSKYGNWYLISFRTDLHVVNWIGDVSLTLQMNKLFIQYTYCTLHYCVHMFCATASCNAFKTMIRYGNCMKASSLQNSTLVRAIKLVKP